MLELPRSCDYWVDKRMRSVVNSKEPFVHDLDSCMFGLRARYRKSKDPIKKAWRVTSWNVAIFRSSARRVMGAINMFHVQVETLEPLKHTLRGLCPPFL